MITLESLQRLLEPLFPGLMGVRITQLEPERVVAELTVRPDLCTAVTQTLLTLDAAAPAKG